MSKNCALSFKKDTQGFCNTIVNGKLRVKQTARIEKTLAVEDNLQVYNDANIGDTVNTCNITIKNQLIYSEPELINESGETLSQLKSLSFINTNGVGELEDGCCNGLYKQIVKINDSEEIGVGWTSVGNTGDIIGFINSVAFESSGDGPYIGGFFLNVADITGLNLLAKWTGSSWTSVGNTGDFNNTVRSIEFAPNGEGPYIGGFFTNVAGIVGLDRLAKWTGSSWTSVGNTGDFSESVNTIAFDQNGDGPYVGGSFINVAGIAGLDRLAKWTGSSWTSIGNTGDISNIVNTIAFDQNGDGPYVGGNFTNVAGITGLDKLAKWTGSSWTSVGNTGDFNNGFIRTIAFGPSGDGPYIGGFFDNVGGITGLNRLAKWTGSSWTSVGNTGDISSTVYSVAFDQNGDGPYIGGVFNNVAGITGLNYLAKWTGSSWTSIGNTGDFNLTIRTITFDPISGNGPYVGGNFSNVAGITGLNSLAKYDTNTFGYELTYNDTETHTLTNNGDSVTFIYNSDPTAEWIKLN